MTTVKTPRRLILLLAPLALALGATTAALGQAAAPAAPRGERMAEMKARHEAMQKQRIEDLKTVLRLRPDQEPALAALIAARHPQGERREMRREPGDRPLTTPERLDRMAKREAEMDARRMRSREALAKFYAALSPEQQKTFDALQRLKGPHGGDGPRGGHMRRMVVHGGPGGGPGAPHDPPN